MLKVKMLFAFALFGAALFGQTTNYPAALDTNTSLFTSADNVQTQLTQPMAISDAVAIVASTTGFAANMLATVCDAQDTTGKCTVWEHMLVTSVTNANTLQVTRAAAGTAARAHVIGLNVSALIDSAHQTALKAAVIALETAVGAGATGAQGAGSKVQRAGTNSGTTGATLCNDGTGSATTANCTPPFPVATAQLQNLRTKANSGNLTTYEFGTQPTASALDYAFTPQTPGGSLATGNQTISMSPCPLGMAGTDVGHYAYISGGVGAAEAALITGGTCTSGAASGTVIVNLANTHSGAWTIGPASGGVQEAANANSYVFIPTGTYKVYGPITLAATVVLQCAGGSNSVLQAQSATLAAIIAVNLASQPVTIRGCGFDASPAKTAGAAITLSAPGSNQNNFTSIQNNIFTNQFIGIDAQKAAYWRIESNHFELNQVNGVGIQVANTISVDSGDQTIRDNTFYGGGSGFTDIKQLSGGGLRVFGNKMLGAAGQTCMSVAVPSGVGTGILFVQGNSFDGCGVDGLIITMTDATSALPDNSIVGNIFNGSPTHALLYIASAVGSSYGRVVISANQFLINTGTAPAIWLHSGGNFHVTSNLVNSANAGSITVDSGVSSSIVAWNPTMNGSIVNNSTSTIVLEALQQGEANFSPGIYIAGVSGISGAATQSLDTNFIATESGANNALVVTLNDPRATAVPLAAGLCLNIKLAHTLQVGANTLSFNGSVKNIKSHLNPANNIGTVYAAGAFFRTCYDGTQFQDMSQ